MKLMKLIRGSMRVTAYIRHNGQTECRTYPKSMTDAEILAQIYGTTAPAPAQAETKEPEKVKTIPTPPILHRRRITREQMIAELEQAKVKVDTTDPAKLKEAYRTMKGGK